MEGEWRKEGTRQARAALIDAATANAARVADYLDGGRDNFEADRKAVLAMMAVAPVVGTIVPAAGAFHRRAVRYLAAEAGMRQFLATGPGLALSGKTHKVSQAVDPACRVVYVDDDAVVLTHARALLTSAPAGAVACVEADVHDPAAVVAASREALDFGQPVAVLLFSTLAFVADIKEAAVLVSSLLDAVPPGSYIAIYHQASDLHPAMRSATRRWNQLSPMPVTLRSRDEIASFAAGLELVPPGVVPVTEWRPTPHDPRFEDVVPLYGLVARKPGGERQA